MKKKALISVFIVMILFLLSGCSKEKSYGDNYKFNYISKNEFVEIPIYLFAEYSNGNLVEEDVLNFVPSNQKIKIEELEEKKYDKNNKIISFKISNSSMIECYHNTRIKEVLYYKFYYIQPTMFDYNTGELYRINKERVNSTEGFKKLDDLSEKDFEYTEINWKNNTYKIGIYQQNLVETRPSENQVDIVDGRDHFKNPVDGYSKVFVLVPNGYDGVTVALDKNGSTKEKVLNQREYEIRKENLEAETKKTGTKSDELIEMEESERKIYKLIDPNNEKRKEYSENSFYVMRLLK